MSGILFLFNRKLRSLLNKTLRVDRTASEWEKALCAPPQAENPARRILFYVMGNSAGFKYQTNVS